MKKILVTGANGFVGRALCKRMASNGRQVRGTVRSEKYWGRLPIGVDAVNIESIGPGTDWSAALADVDIVIHLAARVHVMSETNTNPLSAFRQVNVYGAERLAKEAAAAGIKRFIYVSSVKVNGESTGLRIECQGLNYSEKDDPAPQDPYGISKWEAEEALKKISDKTGLEVVILRPPLVYGPEVKANFLRLLQVAKLGLPLPLGSVDNQRSIIYIANLVDAIIACIKHPKAAGKTFLVSDGEDVSTPELIRMISSAMGKKSRSLPFPPVLLNILGKMTGRSAEIERLTGSLQVDSSKIRKLLDWDPPFTMEQGIQETVDWFMNKR